MRVTASDIVKAIDQLSKNRAYQYVDKKNSGQIEIIRADRPDGPIVIKSYSPAEKQTADDVKEKSISPEMIWRVANAFREGQPINFDRVLAGSYNTRSVLEALLVHTPQFYFCYPGRIEDKNGTTKIKNGHKHVVWRPDLPHANETLSSIETGVSISEIPNLDIVYEALVLPDEVQKPKISIQVQRRHAQIQIALIMIGKHLGFRSWIAQNDKGITYQGNPIGTMEGVINSLRDEKLLASYPNAVKDALLIDCVWFKEDRIMPAVMEVEHTTGITSGLTRMKKFQDSLPPFPTRYVIVAADDEHEKAVREANQVQFKSLDARFLSYNAVEELLSLCQRRDLTGVTDDFIDTYLEKLVK